MTRSRDIADQQKNLGGAVAPFVAGKNVIVNGGMDFWQRSTSATVTAFGYASVDRFYLRPVGGGSCIYSQQTTGVPNGSTYILRAASNSAASAASLSYIIESAQVAQLRGQTVTLSFKMRKNATLTASYTVYVDKSSTIDAAFGATWVNILTDTSPSNSALPTGTGSSNWFQFSKSFTIPNDGTANSIMISLSPNAYDVSGAYFELAQMQLEIGSVATPFSRAGGSIGGELALCQRYYWRTLGQVYTPFCQGMSTLTTGATLYAQHPVPMRIPPSSVEFSSLELSDLYAYGLAVSVVAIDSGSNGTNVSRINVTNASGATAFRPAFLRSANSTSGYLGFSAEL